MERVEDDYEKAFEAMPALPWFFQGPTAIAASVYRGIHKEIRKNGYDNLHRRASTSLLGKVVLAVKGLVALGRARSRWSMVRGDVPMPRPTLGRAERTQAVS